MAGYNGFSQSNNAIEAKREGRWPLSRAAAIVASEAGVTQAVARKTLVAQGACEWHHTSKKFNCVDFFDTNEAIEALADQADAELMAQRDRSATRRAFAEAATRATERQLVIGRLECNQRLAAPMTHGERLELAGEIAAEAERVECERAKHRVGLIAAYKRHATPGRAEALRALGVGPGELS